MGRHPFPFRKQILVRNATGGASYGYLQYMFWWKNKKKQICVYSFVYHNICFVNMSNVIIHMGPDKIITGVIIFVLFKKKNKKLTVWVHILIAIMRLFH